jgi:hypothetical protein
VRSLVRIDRPGALGVPTEREVLPVGTRHDRSPERGGQGMSVLSGDD